MKRLVISLILLVITTMAGMAQVQSLFEKYSGKSGVTTVYVSPQMLKMLSTIPVNGHNVKTSDIESVRVLTTSNSDIINQINAELKAIAKKEGYEIMVSANEGSEKTDIYSKTLSNGSSNFIVANFNSSELNLVFVAGVKSLESLMNIAKM